MRTVFLLALALLAAAGAVWFLFSEGPGSGLQEDPELQAPEQAPASQLPAAPAVRPTGKPPVEITRVDEIPEGILAHLEAAGDTLIDEQETMNEVVLFEFDPRRPRFFTGEDLLRGVSSIRAINKPIRFLRSEDLERVRSHVFPFVIEPRVDAGRLISSFPQLGYRLVAWEGEFYLVPTGGYREPSASIPELDDAGGTEHDR